MLARSRHRGPEYPTPLRRPSPIGYRPGRPPNTVRFTRVPRPCADPLRPASGGRPGVPWRDGRASGWDAPCGDQLIGAELFLCPQPGRIRQAGHRHDRICCFHVLSPAVAGLSTDGHGVVNSADELSPAFSTALRTGTLTACGDHAIVLPTRPPRNNGPRSVRGRQSASPRTTGVSLRSGEQWWRGSEATARWWLATW
jgi:hypothetical protein